MHDLMVKVRKDTWTFRSQVDNTMFRQKPYVIYGAIDFAGVCSVYGNDLDINKQDSLSPAIML